MLSAIELQSQFLDAINSADLDAVERMFHTDYTFVAHDGVTHDGFQGWAAAAGPFVAAFPDLKFEVLKQHASGGDVAVAEYRVTATHTGDLMGIPPTGKVVSITGCLVMESADGKILRERDYFDAATMMRQLGVLPG